MTSPDPIFLRDFFRALHYRPLDPTDPLYVPIYEDERLAANDPVQLMARAIQWTPGKSVQLLSGFRGTGKSTELRRLRKELKAAGYLVVLLDIEDYLNTSVPIDVSDFLIVLAGAFGDALRSDELLGSDASHESYWDRLKAFFTRTKVSVDEISAEAGEGFSVGIKATLKSDPTFKQTLQEKMAGHLGSLVADVRAYLEECVARLKKKHGLTQEVVLLVDSVEHIRGTSVNADAVQASVETLFATHADKLHLPLLHVIYTVHPYLAVRYPNLGVLYAPGGVKLLSAVKVRDAESGALFPPGLDALEKIVAARGDWQRLLENRQVLDRLSALSGGHLRDLLRIVAEVVLRASALPVPGKVVDTALNQVRNEFLPIAESDARWLVRVSRSHDPSLIEPARLPDLARFLDTHLILCYQNGTLWYDVHPLVLDHIKAQVERLVREPPAAES
jgi:hypothetical protein